MNGSSSCLFETVSSPNDGAVCSAGNVRSVADCGGFVRETVERARGNRRPLKEEKMLRIEDLQVKLGDKEILRHIDLEIPDGETHVLFGPNGSGKTSLLMTIMGYPQFRVTGGKMMFKGEDITRMPLNERAKLGIGMSYQRPPTINGVKTRKMVEICGGGKLDDLEGLARKLNFTDFLERDINAGFSGGEIKRSELLQLMAQSPELLLFDEPESGVDLENMALIGNTISEMLQRDFKITPDKSQKEKRRERTRMGLIITHTGFILDYVTADKGQVLYDGELSCTTNAREIFKCISKVGYEECVRCSI